MTKGNQTDKKAIPIQIEKRISQPDLDPDPNVGSDGDPDPDPDPNPGTGTGTQ